MTAPDLLELASERAELFSLSVDQYHQMIGKRILPEGSPYELLGGALVRKDRSHLGEEPRTVGQRHVWSVQQLAELGPKLKRIGCHMRTQQPITLHPNDEPEPDGAIVTGFSIDYRDRHPGAGDLTCVIEVADSSLERDRRLKRRIYAGAGIGMYVIINLTDAVAEVYTLPVPDERHYAREILLQPSEMLDLPGLGGKKIRIRVKKLLP